MWIGHQEAMRSSTPTRPAAYPLVVVVVVASHTTADPSKHGTCMGPNKSLVRIELVTCTLVVHAALARATRALGNRFYHPTY
jgi:hypothetical protein